LDMLDIPYVGSGVLASALAMDKHKAKMLFEQQSIPVPKGKRYRVQQDSEINEIVSHIKQNFECPFVVKPNSEGSTLGLTIIHDKQDTYIKDINALKSDDYNIVEEIIHVIELTITVMGKMTKEEELELLK